MLFLSKQIESEGSKPLIEFHEGFIRVNADLDSQRDIEVMVTALKALQVLLPAELPVAIAPPPAPVAPPAPIRTIDLTASEVQ